MTDNTIKATQTAVNDIYRAALIDFITAQNAPVNNMQIAEGVLGGVMPAELKGAMEPYVPAQLSLVSGRVFAYWKDPETDHMLTDLYDRATDEQRAESNAMVSEQEARMQEKGLTVDYDDPTNHRYTEAEVKERQKEAAAQKVPSDFEELLRDILAGNSPTVH